MLFKDTADFLSSGFRPRVVVVGSGPAGLSIALRLAERRLPCLVVEAGGSEHSAASQDFYRGSVVGDRYFELHEARLRQFGGTTGHWTGWCRALDAIDFEARPKLPHTGWPIGKADLDPYAEAASTLLGVPAQIVDRPLTAELDDIEMRYSAVRFGSRDYRERIEQSPTIGLLLNPRLCPQPRPGFLNNGLKQPFRSFNPYWFAFSTHATHEAPFMTGLRVELDSAAESAASEFGHTGQDLGSARRQSLQPSGFAFITLRCYLVHWIGNRRKTGTCQ